MKRGVKKASPKTGAIRIISGRWRGRKLPVIDVQGLRPTTDRNKETLFNWLMPYIHNSRCLDAYAGSGGLGFEALSRGAQSATFIELDKQALRTLIANVNTLGMSAAQALLLPGRCEAILPTLSDKFDLVFIDPPFGCNMLEPTIQALQTHALLSPGAVIYLECEASAGDYQVPKNWSLLKEKVSSQVITRLYQANA